MTHPRATLAPLLALMLLLFAPSGARADDPDPAPTRLPGSVGPAESDAPSHAWFITATAEGFQLVHAAPRERAARAGAAPAGSARTARPLLERPEALAARADRVYLVFPPTESPSRRKLSIYCSSSGTRSGSAQKNGFCSTASQSFRASAISAGGIAR